MASTTVQHKPEINIKSLLSTAERMSDSDLQHFADEVNLLYIKRQIAAKPQTEEEILEELKLDLTPKDKKRYKALATKLENETITEEERLELWPFIDFMEHLSVYRLERAQKLAAIRNLPFDTVWKQMWFYKERNAY